MQPVCMHLTMFTDGAQITNTIGDCNTEAYDILGERSSQREAMPQQFKIKIALLFGCAADVEARLNVRSMQ